MMLPRTLLALLGVAAFLGACSTISETAHKLNPFSSSEPKIKAAQLDAIEATAELRVDWQANAGAGGDYVFSPAIVGETVYAAARDGSITRYDSGRQAWRIGAAAPLSGGVGAGAKVVVVGTAKAEVLAFNADNGSPLWKAQVSSEILAAPTVADGLVIVRSGDSRIHGLDAKDGKRRWVYQRTTPSLSLRSNVGVRLTERVVLAGFPGGKLVAINVLNGAAVWEVTVGQPKGATELERVADVTSLPVVADRQVCAVAFQGRLACFDPASGSLQWGHEMSSSAGLDADRRYVYVTDDKGTVHAFDRENGTVRWTQDKLFMRGVSRPLAVGRFVAVADYQGFVHLLNREDGTFAARLATDGSAVMADPLPLPGGMLVQTRNGGLFALSIRQ
jgi:outer membrane protein assembly factor BamB